MVAPNPLKCVTVSYGRVRGKARQYSYHEPVVYVEKTLKNGKQVWVVDYACGYARRSHRLATEDAKSIASEQNIPFIVGVRQFRPIPVQTPLAAAA